MAKKAKLMRAYRLPQKTIFEIERLSEEWECTHGEVIERAISQVNTTGSTVHVGIPPRQEDDVYVVPRGLKRGPRPKGDKTR